MNITIELRGGLGNQLFQLALGQYLQARLDADITYDAFPVMVDPKRDIRALRQRLDIPIENDRPVKIFPKVRQRFYRRFNSRVVVEDGVLLGTSGLRDGDILRGYWQRQEFASHIAQQLRDLFAAEASDVARKPSSDRPIVAVHVRRGDYVSDQAVSARHRPCGKAYFDRAFSRLRNAIGAPVFLVFSDDLDWCKANFKGDDVEYHVDKGDEFHTMGTMAQADHHIISNSTFSWWPAYVKEKRDRIVVCPHPWFGSEDEEPEDLIPPDWVRIAK